MDISYFSWLRTKIGQSNESIVLPKDGISLKEFISLLSISEPRYQVLITYQDTIKASVNGQLVNEWDNYRLKETDKISFFSALAGG